MNALSVLTAVLTLLQCAGVIGNFAAITLTAVGASGDALTILKTVSSLAMQSGNLDASVTQLTKQIIAWCDGDTKYTADDLIAQCKTIRSQSKTIQALS